MGEQYILRWHYHESTLCKNLPFLLESDILTDCTLSAGNKNYKAHKLILATCSPYFLQLFQSTGPLEFPVLILHESRAEDIEAILSYIYRGQCLVTNDQLPGLISLAKTLKIQGLCSMKINDTITKNPIVNYADSVLINPCNKEDTDYPNECVEYQQNVAQNNLKTGYGSYENQTDVILEQTKQETFHNATELLHGKKVIKDAPEICKCFICGKYLSNQYNLRVHMETHKHTYYSCLSCPHVSKSRDALRKHVSYRHPEEYISRKRKKHDLT